MRNKKSESYSSHLFVITANFLPDLITIGFHRPVITGLRCVQTLLIIQYAYTFLLGKLLMLFLFFSTFNTLWQASIFPANLARC